MKFKGRFFTWPYQSIPYNFPFKHESKKLDRLPARVHWEIFEQCYFVRQIKK